MEHLSPEAIEALAMGIAPTDAEVVRRHLTQCASCAGRLAREAELEMLLYAAAEAATGEVSPARRPVARSGWRRPLQAAAAFLVMALAAWWVGDTRRPASPPPGIPRSHGVGAVGQAPAAGESVPPGWDTESPRDYGRRVRPSVPGLEASTTRRTDSAGDPAQADDLHDGD